MQRAAPGLRETIAPRLAELEEQNPEWRPLLRLLRETSSALGDPAWHAPLPALAAGAGREPRRDGAPLLEGLELAVDGERVRNLVQRLAETAAEGARYRPARADAVALVAASVRHDRAGIEALAAEAGVEAKALGTVAQLAALPLLHACGRLLRDRIPAHWPRGYCPVCAAWPILVEVRGLDRSRHLRCGRCAADWPVSWLACPFCGERQHTRLGSLVPQEREQATWTVETCASCRGYLKSVATLQEVPPFELLLRDLESIELDLVAADRGYARPAASGYPLDVRVTARPA